MLNEKRNFLIPLEKEVEKLNSNTKTTQGQLDEDRNKLALAKSSNETKIKWAEENLICAKLVSQYAAIEKDDQQLNLKKKEITELLETKGALENDQLEKNNTEIGRAHV